PQAGTRRGCLRGRRRGGGAAARAPPGARGTAMRESRPPQAPPPPIEGLQDSEETRDQRQISGHKALTALCSALRGARSYSWDHEIFTPLLDTFQQAALNLLGNEGKFELELMGDAFHVNGQAIALDPASVPLAAALRTELR